MLLHSTWIKVQEVDSCLQRSSCQLLRTGLATPLLQSAVPACCSTQLGSKSRRWIPAFNALPANYSALGLPRLCCKVLCLHAAPLNLDQSPGGGFLPSTLFLPTTPHWACHAFVAKCCACMLLHSTWIKVQEVDSCLQRSS